MLDHIPTVPGQDQDVFDAGVNGSAAADTHEEIPRVTSIDDFELCRIVKDKGKSSSGAGSTYEVLDPASPIMGLLGNWEVLYVKFRDEDGKSSLACCLSCLSL